MSVLKKLMTALRGGVREIGDSVVDANSVRIFEQEIKDAEDAIMEAKEGLTEVMAQEMQAKRQVSSLSEEIQTHEEYVAQALDKNNEALAVDLAEKVADFENQQEEQESIRKGLTDQVASLKQHIKAAEKTIKENKRQLSMVKTTESLQKATMAVQDSLVSKNSAFTSGRESLERIKSRQQMRADQLAASYELANEDTNADLNERMEAAGIGPQKTQASDVLNRVKAARPKS